MRHLSGLTAAAAIFASGALAPAAPAFSQGQTGSRISQIIVYGNDPCPRSSEDEVVVCARKPESERYRIPERYRPSGTRQQMQSWANRAKAIEYVGRTGTMTCSPVGPGGYTGCLSQEIARAKAEYQDNQRTDVPPPPQ